MNLDLDETQRLLRETVREYLAAELSFDRIRGLEAQQGWDEGLWKGVCDQGWIGVAFAEALGGAGGCLVDLGLLVEGFAARAAMVPILEVAVAGRALQQAGEDAASLVAGVLAGEVVAVPALLERDDRFDAPALCAQDDGTLRGEKLFVDYGQHATHHVVSALSGGEPGLHLVEVGRAVRCEPLRSIGRTPVCRVRYEGAPSRRLGGSEALADAIRLGRTLAALQCVGSMQTSLDMTVAYAKAREQFGRPIGTFQAVRHHCANMAMRIASARDLCFEALSALDAGVPDDLAVAAAKASASRAAPEVLMLGHQIHGGNGVIEENDLYFFTLRGRERALAWGSVDECLAVLAGHAGESLGAL